MGQGTQSRELHSKHVISTGGSRLDVVIST